MEDLAGMKLRVSNDPVMTGIQNFCAGTESAEKGTNMKIRKKWMAVLLLPAAFAVAAVIWKIQAPAEAVPEYVFIYAENQAADYPTTQGAEYFAELVEESSKHMWTVLDGEIGDRCLAMTDSCELVGLSWYDAGVGSFYTSEKKSPVWRTCRV